MYMFLGFLIILTVAMNAMLTLGLLSKLNDRLVSRKWKIVLIFSMYLTLTYTLVLMTDQMLGVIILSYLPILAVYEFFDYKTIMWAILVNPFVILIYNWSFDIPITGGEFLYTLVSTYISLMIALYLFGKGTDNQMRLIAVGILLSTFEIVQQIRWYSLMPNDIILFTGMNIFAYSIAIILIDLLYVRLLNFEKDMYQDTYVDTLTNLYNFKAFDEDYDKEFVNYNYLLAIVDINGFKVINDTFGHAKGNMILEIASDLLAESFAPHYNLLDYKVYRYGGEELITSIRLDEHLDLKTQFDEVERILNDVNAKLGDRTADIIHQRVSFSGGMTAYSFCDFNNEATFERADQLLYKAKADKNIVIKVDDAL
ncbi:diguanylate cyclase [Weissella tructae]|uniref:GGDEF domain-containing protein n=3 Tax=Weissella TaxID=46255 RepID=A0A075U0Q5_9LACO|nr:MULTISPECIES: GGDEF domain-containing protein [Weissella]AIG65773.1 hypothetical protein WS08_0834 [Weissella tructae]AIM63152.1 hypothetical protein WS74_0900 [Weissella ceti]AIM64488.1 hypothetical protein WS105_0898 [Weissella ceti]QVV90935.1 GGDEF domain-containing protein [Weissella tructae]